MENADKIWQAALGELELQMTRATFNTWLKPTRVVACDDRNLVVGVPNGYIKDWLQNRLYTPIQRTVSDIMARTVDVQFVVWSDEQDVDEEGENLPLLKQNSSETGDPSPEMGQTAYAGRNGNGQMSLNPRYTFDTFVVGSNNRLAHAAARAVADSPSAAYNPLFLYGGVGLGKTHLLHAIGHSSQQKNLRVLYVSSEQFTNDLINAIRTQGTEEFRAKYRNPDVLLIDDIQFIAGKESTQEEFFHTFNTLHAANKQIILTSDRPPKSIPTLEERLRSRFEWGLIADIQPPDLETRIAILQFKARQQRLSVSQDVLAIIAQRVVTNIRELEGALNRAVAFAQLTNTPLSVETIEMVLRDFVAAPKTLLPAQVVQAVAQFYNVEVDELTGRKRNKEIVRPRQVAMYLLRKETAASLPEIGEALGGRDHTTVLYGIEKIEGQIDQDSVLRREIMAIQERLYNRHR